MRFSCCGLVAVSEDRPAKSSVGAAPLASRGLSGIASCCRLDTPPPGSDSTAKEGS